MKSKEELNELKKEYENFNKKINELSQDELKQVVGGGRSDKEKCSMKDSRYYPVCPFSRSHIELNMCDKDSPCLDCEKNYVLNDGHWSQKQIWGKDDYEK